MKLRIQFLWVCVILSPIAVMAQTQGENDDLNRARELYAKAKTGDYEAMLWVIRQRLAHVGEGGVGSTPFQGLPAETDQITLVLEIVSRDPKNEEEKSEKIWGINWLAYQQDPRVEQFLERLALDDGQSMDYRSRAITALPGHWPDDSRRILRQLASDPDKWVRVEVVFACKSWFDPDAEALLQTLLTDEDLNVRATAKSAMEYWQKHCGEEVHGKNRNEMPKSNEKNSSGARSSPSPVAQGSHLKASAEKSRTPWVDSPATLFTWERIAAAAVLLLLALAAGVVFVRRMRSPV